MNHKMQVDGLQENIWKSWNTFKCNDYFVHGFVCLFGVFFGFFLGGGSITSFHLWRHLWSDLYISCKFSEREHWCNTQDSRLHLLIQCTSWHNEVYSHCICRNYMHMKCYLYVRAKPFLSFLFLFTVYIFLFQ